MESGWNCTLNKDVYLAFSFQSYPLCPLPSLNGWRSCRHFSRKPSRVIKEVTFLSNRALGLGGIRLDVVENDPPEMGSNPRRLVLEASTVTTASRTRRNICFSTSVNVIFEIGDHVKRQNSSTKSKRSTRGDGTKDLFIYLQKPVEAVELDTHYLQVRNVVRCHNMYSNLRFLQ